MSHLLTIPQCNCGGNSWTGVSASPVILRCDKCGAENVATFGAIAEPGTRITIAASAFGDGIASSTNRPFGPLHCPVRVQEDWPITVNVSAPWFGDPHEVAKATWKHAGRPERAVTFRRIFGFIAEFAKLQAAFECAALSRPGLTRGDWLAMRGGL